MRHARAATRHAHAATHSETRTRERRQRLAIEAARLMSEHGIRDYHQAKRKAAQRLGIHDDASLPRNSEIEQALREYQRLFSAESQPQLLRVRREAAARAMEFFQRFEPRLVGSVLEGTADAHSAVCLQLHTDDVDSVPRLLTEHGIPAEAGSRGRRPKGPIVRKPTIDPKPPTPRAYRLVRLSGGFALRADKGISQDKLPFVIRVRAAYDVLRGNPFSKHDALDFDFENDELKVSAEGAVVTAQGPNVLLVRVTTLQFDVEVRGFDQKRDLIIDPARVQ